MCEYESIVLSAIIILLTVIILLLLYLLTKKICLWETDQANSSSLPDDEILRFLKPTVKSNETPLSVVRNPWTNFVQKMEFWLRGSAHMMSTIFFQKRHLNKCLNIVIS